MFRLSQTVVFCAAGLSFGRLALAFPMYGTNDKLAALEQAISQDPVVGSSTFLVDSEKKNLIYMLPPTIQHGKGGSAPVGFARCGGLESLYKTTYQMPTDDPQDYHKHVDDIYVSAFFAKTFQNTALSLAYEQKYRSKLEELQALERQHQPEYEAYERTKDNLDAISLEIETLGLDIRALQQDKRAALEGIGGDTAEERAESRRRAYAECDRIDAQIMRKNDLAVSLHDEKAIARRAHTEARAKWRPYEKQHDDLQRTTELGHASLTLSTQIAKTAFEDSLADLNKIGAAKVAWASAGYNIYGDSLTRVRAAISQNYSAQGLTVEAMPLSGVNTSVLAGGFNHVLEVSGDNLNTKGSFSVATLNQSNARPMGYEPKPVPSFFKDENGKPLSILQRAFDMGLAVGTFEADVTLGAYCTGKSELDYSEHTAELGSHRLTWQTPKYESRKPNNALYQTVALNYQYLVKGEPAEVNCRVDISSVVKLFRENGEARNFFTTRKWDKSTRDSVRKSGILCKVTPAPDDTIGDPGALRERLQQKEEDYSKAVVQEVLNTFGVDVTWTVEMPNPGELGLNPIEAKMRMPGLCQNTFIGIPVGGRFHCQLSEATTKSIQALFGSSTQASGSKDSRFEGKVERSYSEDTLRRLTASSAISLSVDMPN